MAGLIWDAGTQKIAYGLPHINADAARKLISEQRLDSDSQIRDYIDRTNLSSRTLNACDLLARHFYGTVIQKSDGSPWGVLLLDSFEAACPFLEEGEPAEVFVQRFNDFSRLIGQFVT